MELMVVAGEASGDHHAADLASALRQRQPGLHLSGMGGGALAAAGQEQLVDMAPLSVMGLAEVVGTLGYARRALRCLRHQLLSRRPQALVLVDFPDFNMRLARFAKRQGIPVVYFISPQIWAWRTGRVGALRRDVDLMICILPFEPPFYESHGVEAVFAGHPLVDQVPALPSRSALRERFQLPREGTILALLPGSRRQELRHLLPELLAAARRLQHRPGLAGSVLPLAPGLRQQDVDKAAGPHGLPPGMRVLEGAFYEALGCADLALVASGTATLATAMVGIPMVLGYRLSPLTWVPVRYLTSVPHAGLVNLVAGRRLVPELLQDDFNSENLTRAARRLLASAEERQLQREGFRQVRARLGPAGAAGRAADLILQLVSRAAASGDQTDASGGPA